MLSLARTSPSAYGGRDVGAAVQCSDVVCYGCRCGVFSGMYFVFLSSSDMSRTDTFLRNKCLCFCHSSYGLCRLVVALQGKAEGDFVQPFPHGLGVGGDVQ